jgi:hypothetical protein
VVATPGAGGLRDRDECDERADVVALEGVQIAGQQFLLLAVHPPWIRRVVVERIERGAGALEGAVDRGDGRAEQVRHFAGPPAQDFAQDQHRQLSRRQMPQGCQLGEADRLQRRGQLGRGRHRRGAT